MNRAVLNKFWMTINELSFKSLWQGLV